MILTSAELAGIGHQTCAQSCGYLSYRLLDLLDKPLSRGGFFWWVNVFSVLFENYWSVSSLLQASVLCSVLL